jgi:hypothetical protein
MRTSRIGMGAVIIGATLWTQLATAGSAAADGGAYIELNRTYYQPGDQAIAEAYVAIPKSEQGILQRGPFWVYVLPRDVRSLKPGSPVPSGAVRVGMFTVEAANGAFELRARFSVPQLADGYYSIGTCNDPCTVAGFKEPLTGTFGIVATAREAALLKENGTLRSKVFGLQRQLRKATQEEELVQGQLATAQRERDLMTRAVKELQQQLAVAEARATSAEARRPVVPWIVAGVAIGLLLIVCGLLFARRLSRLRAERPSEAPDGGFDHELGTEGLRHRSKVLEDRLGDVLTGEPWDPALGEAPVDAQIDRMQASVHVSALEDELGDDASPEAIFDEAILEHGGDVGVRQ